MALTGFMDAGTAVGGLIDYARDELDPTPLADGQTIEPGYVQQAQEQQPGRGARRRLPLQSA